MNFFVVNISQCHLRNRMTINLKLSEEINVIDESEAGLRQRTGLCLRRKLK